MTHDARRLSYECRPLPRPDEQVVDQGLGFDVGTLLDRRRLLRVVGLGAVAVGLAACGTGTTSPATSPSAGSATAAAEPAVASTAETSDTTPTSDTGTATGEIPDETAGPYPGDGSNGPDVLEQSGIVRSDLRSSFGQASRTAAGVPITLRLSVTDLARAGAPFAGVAVYVWHCDREGRYSLYSDGITSENYLRGVQIADADGVVEYSSIFPACYSGRWPHIHFEVYPDRDSITDVSTAIATSQVALPQDVCETVYGQAGYEASVGNLARVSLSTDNVFGDDGGARQLATVTGTVSSGLSVALQVGIDTSTAPTGGQLHGGGTPSGAPGGAPPAG
ncbi:dioxygenase family protein [Nakamurella endophytica]|uniref:Intradiol ring-cleavage dioxygenases domain-containing protein n=1 Tax=Nakamurella endophytica TaxID=1748367 RepID=A0A917STN0_9ACTN|nr:3,4-dioxygenase subunit beta [Nakamurella endophytica]GGL94389.1 hypothetical protein GCM10011594_12730 [Nakamurella endophytica]